LHGEGNRRLISVLNDMLVSTYRTVGRPAVRMTAE
jgi:hypothetical protein